MTNSWAVHMNSGGAKAARAADALVKKYGFINLGQVAKSNIHSMTPQLF